MCEANVVIISKFYKIFFFPVYCSFDDLMEISPKFILGNSLKSIFIRMIPWITDNDARRTQNSSQSRSCQLALLYYFILLLQFYHRILIVLWFYVTLI